MSTKPVSDTKVLDEPWEQHVPDVSTRVEAALKHAGVKTLGEAIRALRSGELLSQLGFGLWSQRELRVALKPYEHLLEPHTIPTPGAEQVAVLDEPWEDHLLEIPWRAARALRQMGIKTVRDALRASRNGLLVSQRGFGWFSQQALREAVGPYDHLDCTLPAEPTVTPDQLAVLDEPWEEHLPDLPYRVRKGLRHANLKTTREVVETARGNILLRVPNFGSVSLRALRKVTVKFEWLMAGGSGEGDAVRPSHTGDSADSSGGVTDLP